MKGRSTHRLWDGMCQGDYVVYVRSILPVMILTSHVYVAINPFIHKNKSDTTPNFWRLLLDIAEYKDIIVFTSIWSVIHVTT
jgi:hypothetical protein